MAGCLIEQQDFRLTIEGTRKKPPLALAAGERITHNRLPESRATEHTHHRQLQAIETFIRPVFDGTPTLHEDA